VSRRTADASTGLLVIGAGFGRTGTTSLKRALERLGHGPCYHMQTAMTRPGHSRFWLEARRRDGADFRRFLRRYRAAIDWPACEFHRELLEAFPDAKVILTTRPPDAWYASVRETLWEIDQALPWWFPPSILRMHEEVIWQARFGGRFLDRDHAIAVYRIHMQQVRDTVPADRLLELEVGQGWEPLCRFLDCPVPAEPYPRLNDRRLFRRLIRALRVAQWAVPLVVAVGVVAAVLWVV
jgi:hypothetical protein